MSNNSITFQRNVKNYFASSFAKFVQWLGASIDKKLFHDKEKLVKLIFWCEKKNMTSFYPVRETLSTFYSLQGQVFLNEENLAHSNAPKGNRLRSKI